MFPAGRQADDWAWAFGYSGPAFTEDANAVPLAEASLRERGLRAQYVEELCRLPVPPRDPAALTPEDVFELAAAPADARALAAWATYHRAKDEGRI